VHRETIIRRPQALDITSPRVRGLSTLLYGQYSQKTLSHVPGSPCRMEVAPQPIVDGNSPSQALPDCREVSRRQLSYDSV
jgi:hypothetical protein